MDFPLYILSRYGSAQSTYTYRVPKCMSPLLNWDSPTPSLASECVLPPGTNGGEGGAHSPAMGGWGSPNSDDWRKSLALCLLCAAVCFIISRNSRNDKFPFLIFLFSVVQIGALSTLASQFQRKGEKEVFFICSSSIVKGFLELL
jgi:hypothetical protein